MLDSVNLPDKTFAERFVLVLKLFIGNNFRVWYILPSVIKKANSSKRGINVPQDFFIISLKKTVNFSQNVCFKLFNAWNSRYNKQVKNPRL